MDWETLEYSKALEGAYFLHGRPLGPLIHILGASLLDTLSTLEDGKQILSCKRWLNYNWSNQFHTRGADPNALKISPEAQLVPKRVWKRDRKKKLNPVR